MRREDYFQPANDKKIRQKDTLPGINSLEILPEVKTILPGRPLFFLHEDW